jgi:hypothetical protein
MLLNGRAHGRNAAEAGAAVARRPDASRGSEGDDEEAGRLSRELIREVNDRVTEASRSLSVGSGELLELVCECSRPTCGDIVALTRTEYERVRLHRGRYVVVPGHEEQHEPAFFSCARYVVVGCPPGSASGSAETTNRERGSPSVE